ncbi:mannosyltransferase putative-domain-containing protein [Aspergillus floccosus]
MRFLHGLLGPRSIRLVALASAAATTLLLTIYFLTPRISDDFWLFYWPPAEPTPDIPLVKALSRYAATHPIKAPYQQAYGNVGKRSALVRQWLTLAQQSSNSDTKALLNGLSEDLAGSTFPFLGRSQSQHPLSDLRSSFDPGTTGIVIPTSDGSIRSAMRLVHNLRAVLGSTLPIQIAYAGDTDLALANRELLSRLEIPGPPIEFLDVNAVFDASVTQLEVGGWETKPFAALGSRFERVLVAGPEVGFFQAPEAFLADETVTHAGAWMAKDRLYWYHAYADPVNWDRYIAPDVEKYTLPDKTIHTALFIVDAGLAFFNKARLDILLGLMCVGWQHSYAVRNELTHPLRYGSRDVWWRGLEMTGARFVESDHYGGVLGWEGGGRDGARVCGSAVAHVDSAGRLLWWKGEPASDPEKIPTKWMIEGWSPGPFRAVWEEIRGTYGEIRESISRGIYCMVGEEAGSLSGEELDIVERVIRYTNPRS